MFSTIYKGQVENGNRGAIHCRTEYHLLTSSPNLCKRKEPTLDRQAREILQICPKILGQEFEDLPLEQDILSFIRDLGHTGDITYLTDVNVDYLHQPWRAFATVINKCLSGKETRMDKIRLSRAQIL
ncbi:hypothetical protein Tco_0364866 [Tanacetum coccineum]